MAYNPNMYMPYGYGYQQNVPIKPRIDRSASVWGCF
jgi:hypothetical protein